MVNYLTTATAASTYLSITNAASTYLSITNAASTYLTQANALSTYLSITNAASTYLTQANASSTYLDKANNLTQTIIGQKTFQNNLTCSAQLLCNNKQGLTTTSACYLWNNLIAGGTISIGTSASSCSIESATTFNNGAVFNTSLPTSTQTPSNPTDLTTKTYVDTFLTQANAVSTYLSIANATSTYLSIANATSTYLSIANATSTYLTQANALSTYARLTANNGFSGFNTFTNGLTIRDTLLLKDILNVKESSIYLDTSGILGISCSVNSGKITLQTHDASGSSYNRLFVNENEVNITAPLTLSVDYSYYNPVIFTSTRMGYIMTNTGSSINFAGTGVGINSGQLSIPAGSWNIAYTGTINITSTIGTLTSLEIFIADSFNVDLNIIGLDRLEYYKMSSAANGQKIKISSSGSVVNYLSTSIVYNLRLIPVYSGGGAANFVGSISATRNA